MKRDDKLDEDSGRLTKEEWGGFIRKRRRSLGLSQASLARKTGIAQGIVSLLERGKQKRVKKYNLNKFAEALECTKEELLEKFPQNENDRPKTDLGETIQAGRKKLSLTYDQFAKRMRISKYQARYLEIGNKQYLRCKLARKIATALELEPVIFSKFIQKNQKPTDSELGRLIRKSRTKLLMDTVALAGRLGISKQAVSQIETGQHRLVSRESDALVLKLAKALHLEVEKIQAVRPKKGSKKPNQAVKKRTPLGRFISAERLKLGLTQKELGARARISYQFISELETGKVILSQKARQKIEKGLDCKIPLNLPTSN